MKYRYKILSFILSIMIVISNITIPAYAVENNIDSVSENDIIVSDDENTETESSAVDKGNDNSIAVEGEAQITVETERIETTESENSEAEDTQEESVETENPEAESNDIENTVSENVLFSETAGEGTEADLCAAYVDAYADEIIEVYVNPLYADIIN